jgi:hypothetical protein
VKERDLIIITIFVACNFLKRVLKLLKTQRPKRVLYMILNNYNNYNNYKYVICCDCGNGMFRTKLRYLSASNAVMNHEVSERIVKRQAWCATSVIGPILFAGHKSTPTLSETHFWDHLDTRPITVEYKRPFSNIIQQFLKCSNKMTLFCTVFYSL